MQISSIIRRAAQVNPNGIATIFEDRQQSWSQMLERVAQIGRSVTKPWIKSRRSGGFVIPEL